MLPPSYYRLKSFLDYLLELLDVSIHILLRHLEVLEAAREILVVCTHVDQSVTREVEEQHFCLALFLAPLGFPDRRRYRMTRLRCRYYALRPRKQDSCLEALQLLDVDSLHHLVLQELADYRTRTMIT